MMAASVVLPSVLVVEDEMLLRMRAVDMVEDAGFTPIEAINADDALAILERWRFIKIILGSGQLKLTDDDKPADSRFFGKPLDVKHMMAEMQDMMGNGSLKIAPSD